MNDLIQRVVNAIIRQEGMSEINTNPGNLRAAPWSKQPVINGFWRPASRAEGIAGAAHEVALRIAEGQTLAELIGAWAPPSENNTVTYIANVSRWANIDNHDIPLWNLIGD